MWCLFNVQGTFHQTYARDNYWLSSVNLQQRIDGASFGSLWEMRDCVANLHGITQCSNMETQVQEHWLDLLNFLNLLLQSIGGQSHSWALQQIRERFGTNCGVSKKNKNWQIESSGTIWKIRELPLPKPLQECNHPLCPWAIWWQHYPHNLCQCSNRICLEMRIYQWCRDFNNPNNL